MTAVHGLTVVADATAWERIGLRIVDGESWVGGIRLRFLQPGTGPYDRGAGPAGVVEWTLSGCPTDDVLIDGLATDHIDTETADAECAAAERTGWEHPMGAIAFDHLVVMTSSIDRTCGAIETATGEPLKRIREAGPVRQGFHRLGPAIIEVVESSQVRSDSAEFWGFVLIVDDIDELAGELGPDVMSLPRAAVQPGRRIATFRQQVGLGLPLAVMSR